MNILKGFMRQKKILLQRRRTNMHGKVWMFSNLIDDEDLAFLQREFVSYQQAMDYYGLGYKPNCQAVSYIGICL